MQRQYEMVDKIFKEILPEEGFNIRKNQIKLCKHYCDILNDRSISLSEAGVGIGKTYAYIIACIINQHFRPVDQRAVMNFPYSPNSNMPYLIVTSSIQLQKEIRDNYIPHLSRILVKHNIITSPLTAKVAKGKKNYICREKLVTYIKDIIRSNGDKTELVELKRLLDKNIIDLDKAHIGLYDKRRICVSQCGSLCEHRHKCRYHNMKQHLASQNNFFIICNHNYFVADLIHRKDNRKPLLPNYRAVILDESHKYKDAVLSITSQSIEYKELENLFVRLKKASKRCKGYEDCKEPINALYESTKELFRLVSLQQYNNLNNDSSDIIIYTTDEIKRVVNRIIYNLKVIRHILVSRKTTQLIKRLDSTIEKLRNFINMDEYFSWWLNNEMGIYALNFASYDYGKVLKNMQWKKSIPFVLTSGTLSVDNDFSYFIRNLHLNGMAAHRLIKVNFPSPYDYSKNCMIYYSNNTIPNSYDSPENLDTYIDSIAAEVLNLINASKGRTLVLFTSYKILNLVREQIENEIAFPLIVSEKGNHSAVEEFRLTNNSVLFSTNAWEGIDIQGDALTSVIVTKLPFPVPNNHSEYIQSQYPSFNEYLNNEIIPNMQIKLKQGFGRLVRHENDGGIIAILDARARGNGQYKQFVSQCLPSCRETTRITTVRRFIDKRDSNK